jgi:hypothetical protein
MSNDNNNLFDSIENRIDAKAGNPVSGQVPSQNEEGAEFQKELAVREKLQAAWNDSKKFEEIKDQINSIHMQQKTPKQTMRYLSYAAAACLVILLAIPGYQFFVKQNSKTLEMNETEIKSAVTFFDTRYKQISPINGQLFGDESILFEWDTALDVKTNLVITDTETGKIVFTQSVNSEAKQFKFNQYLGKGKYSWRLEGFSGEMIFVMK